MMTDAFPTELQQEEAYLTLLTQYKTIPVTMRTT
ncbi:hypothetical protein ACLKMH_23420 [Psychromonas sp. KJ10-10]